MTTTEGVRVMAHNDYLKQPALSASGAKLLLPPSCPALFKHDRDTPRTESKPVFDFGTAAHTMVLGAGEPIEVIDADNWTTKAAKELRDAAYAAGRTPLLTKDYAVVVAMAAAIKAHPIASKLFDPALGKPEQSLFTTDKRTGVELRGRLDWLRNPRSDGFMIVPDLKTAASAAPDKFSRSMADYGYAQQAAWYEDLVIALGLATKARFVFVVIEKVAPYLISVFQPDDRAMEIGRILNRRAIDLFKKCTDEDHWPGYSDSIEVLSLPQYFERQFDDITLQGETAA